MYGHLSCFWISVDNLISQLWQWNHSRWLQWTYLPKIHFNNFFYYFERYYESEASNIRFRFSVFFIRFHSFVRAFILPYSLFQRHLSFTVTSLSPLPLFLRYLSFTVTYREKAVSQSKILSWKIMCSRTVDLFISILLRTTKIRCLFLSWLVRCLWEPRWCSKISSKHA